VVIKNNYHGVSPVRSKTKAKPNQNSSYPIIKVDFVGSIQYQVVEILGYCTYLDRDLADHDEQGWSQLTSIALRWLDVGQGLWLLEVTIFDRLRSLMRLGTLLLFNPSTGIFCNKFP
jgi:hypothetical protein